MSAGGSAVKVAVRCRPLNDREIQANTKIIVKMQGNQVVLTDTEKQVAAGQPEAVRPFTFDYAFWSTDRNDAHYAGQDKVFAELGETVLNHAFDGYNTALLAYGQTGSGKSYSMMGYDGEPGIIPRLCEAIFQRVEGNKDANVTFKVEVSYLEIYNERVKDLLNPAMKDHTCKVREHPVLGPYVEDLSKLLVGNLQDIQRLMDEGNKARTVAATAMNALSSRSHAIFTLVLTQIKFDPDVKMTSEKTSKISLVDLAGSERAGKSGTTGDRLKEGANINKSLSTLGLVIKALAEQDTSSKGGKQAFVPYRDSVLTWLLKDNLGGNSKTIMIATLSPAAVNFEETLSTLRYANSAKNIVNKAVVNEDANARIIRELKEEIVELRRKLASGGGSGGTVAAVVDTGNDEVVLKLKDQLKESERLITELSLSWEEKKRNSENSIKVGNKITVDHNSLPYLLNLNDDPLYVDVLLYEIRPGITKIGSEGNPDEHDIILSAPDVAPQHAVLENLGEEVYLIPFGATYEPSIPSSTPIVSTLTPTLSTDEATDDALLKDDAPSAVKAVSLTADNDTVNHDPEGISDDASGALKENGSVASTEVDPSLGDTQSLQSSSLPSSPKREGPGYAPVFINNKLVQKRVQLRQGYRISFGRFHMYRFNHPAEAARMRQERLAGLTSSPSTKSLLGVTSSGDESLTLDTSMSEDGGYLDNSVVSFGDDSFSYYNSDSVVSTPIDRKPQTPVVDTAQQAIAAEMAKKIRDLELQVASEKERAEVLEESRLAYERRIKEMHHELTQLQILIPSFLLVGDNTIKSHHEYVVEIVLNRERWVVMRRYSEFLDQHQKLMTKMPMTPFLINTFPKKRLLQAQNDAQAEQRRERLQTYLRGVVAELLRQPYSNLKNNLNRDLLCEELPLLDPDFNQDKRSQMSLPAK